MLKLLSLFITLSLIITCTTKVDPAKQLAKTHCGSCHNFPEPFLLDKSTWKEKVLPKMANLMGIDPVFETNLNSDIKPSVSLEDWKKILNYYMANSPEKMPQQGREPIKKFTSIFEIIKKEVNAAQIPSSSFVKIDTGNNFIYVGNAFDSSLLTYDEQLNLLSHHSIHSTLIDINFTGLPEEKGQRSGYFTNIGIMNPNDQQTGSVYRFSMSGNSFSAEKIFDSIPRPVQTIPYDLDKNGSLDFLICGFGNNSGKLYWQKAIAANQFEEKILLPYPGALKCIVRDFNNDGLPDILALMAQAREGFYLFLNKGNGNFESTQLLSFPPVYGSSYFEIQDFNKDGLPDILYTCGDNADYSAGVLKNYHGIYIFLNKGNNQFTRQYFFPIHGCYKAMAKDFDLDGDLDIAAVSYFPDITNQPQESFIFLEQTKNFEFAAYGIKEYNEGRWLVMDAGDIDGDGDDDIVLGSLVPPIEGQQENWRKRGIQKSSLMLLKNTSRN